MADTTAIVSAELFLLITPLYSIFYFKPDPAIFGKSDVLKKMNALKVMENSLLEKKHFEEIKSHIWEIVSISGQSKSDLVKSVLKELKKSFGLDGVFFFNLGVTDGDSLHTILIENGDEITTLGGDSIGDKLLIEENFSHIILKRGSVSEKGGKIAEKLFQKRGYGSALILDVRAGSEQRGLLVLADRNKNKKWDIPFVRMCKEIASILSIRINQIASLEEKDALADKLRQREKLEAIGQLAGGIAHDFNNILGIIMGFAEMISLNTPEGGENRKFVDTIIKSVNRASGLTHKMLTFARKGREQVVWVNIHELINNVIILLENSLDLNIELEKDLSASEVSIEGDPGMLQNAFLNVAINSRDSIEKEGRITFSTQDVEINENQMQTAKGDFLNAGKYVKVVISDNGSGMDKETVGKLFEPFFTTKEVGKGTGLGLASVYGCVKAHKGGIEIDSEPGEGTFFIMYFPVTRES
ncbi:MAG: two-component system sensor histidine kinase NtrB [Fibrobacterota bacterium]